VDETNTNEELQEELRKRDLPVSGTKPELLDRLAEDDEARAAANDDPDSGRTAEGTPPVVGNEGGVIEKGTGDFAPGSGPNAGQAPSNVDTVTVQDAQGKDVEVEVGLDGEEPVSPQNPPKKAVLGGGRAAEAEGTDRG
jgi:hypothetical protein